MKQIVMDSVKELMPHLEELRKIKIWVCSSACGKSYLTQIDDRFYDLDSYRSELHHSNIEDFEDRTIPKMWEELDKGKIILNAPHTHFLKFLAENHLPFVYMYGKPEVEEEYQQRMRHRGNNEDFIQRFGTIIKSLYPTRAKDERGDFKIEMNPNEFVSDYVWKVFGLPKKYVQNHDFKGDQYKMAFVDLDGTLLNRESQLSDFTKQKIVLLKDKIHIVLTSGRGVDTITPILKQLKLDDENSIITCLNGGVIMRGNGEILEQHFLAKKSVKALLSQIDQQYFHNIFLRTLYHKTCVTQIEDVDDFIKSNDVYKVMFVAAHDEANQLLAGLDKNLCDRFNIFYAAEELLEFVAKDVDKAKACQKIAKLYYLKRKNLIGIGDFDNDIRLFGCVDCSVAVCNASEKVKKCAKYITDSNNDDGAVKALLKICNTF